MLCACNFNKVDVKIEKTSYETQNEIVSVERPVIVGLKSTELEEKINTEYENELDEMLNDFLNNSQTDDEERVEKARLEICQEVKYNKNNFLSIVGECVEYTNGINGTGSRKVLNIDTVNGYELKLADLFCDEEYEDMLNERLLKLTEQEIYSDIWETPIIGEEQQEYFYLTEDGLIIFYPPYELSYYARGFVEFKIPYNDLYGYLKPEYAFLYR